MTPAGSTSLSLVCPPFSPVDVALVLAPARAKVLGSQCVELLRSLDGLEAEVAQPPLLVVPASTWNAILLTGLAVPVRPQARVYGASGGVWPKH